MRADSPIVINIQLICELPELLEIPFLVDLALQEISEVAH